MRLIDADALINYCNNLKDKTIDANDIARFPNVSGWISVKDRMPENAKHPGAFCPRYLVYTDYGITEGWYNPDRGCWYGFLTFMIDSNELNVRNIDLERGDVPKRVKNLPVKYWMQMPEPPQEETE